MALWWGLGQLVAGLWAWAFIPNFSCKAAAGCVKANNWGWRYVWFANGALVFVMSILRVTVVRLKETPKFLVGEGRDEDVVEVLQSIAQKYNRPCSLTLEKMTACGVTGAFNKPEGFKARSWFIFAACLKPGRSASRRLLSGSHGP